MRGQLLCLASLSLLLGLAWPRCLQQYSAGPHRPVYYGGQQIALSLECSSRISHQISNFILKILLSEVLGYPDINIKNHDSINASHALARIAGCPLHLCGKAGEDHVPESMVNIEVWTAPDFDSRPWEATGRVQYAGQLGPQGRLGWFLATSVVEEFWRKGVILDHWRALLMPEVARALSWRERLEQHEVCVESGCLRHAFTSTACVEARNHSQHCATLFSSYSGLDQGVLQEQVEGLRLPVEIVWLGSGLDTVVRDSVRQRQPLLFFSWHQSSLTTGGNFTRLALPRCPDTSPAPRPQACDFPANQLSKMLWPKLSTLAPEAHYVIRELGFSQQEYGSLLRLYNQARPGRSCEDVACQWLRENPNRFQRWLPPDLSNKTKIFLGGLFPLSGSVWAQPGLVEGAQLAIELVNRNSSVLPNFYLELLVRDSQCVPDQAMKAFIRFITDTATPVAGILGPGCSDTAEPIAALAKHFNMVAVSYGAEAASLADRSRYPFFFRTIPQVNQHRFVYSQFFRAMGWQQVGAIAEGGQELPQQQLQLQSFLQEAGITLAVKQLIPQGASNFDVSGIFAALREKNVKIIIADFYVMAARAVMCEAYRQRMTAYDGYVWFLPFWYSADWWDVDYYNSPPNPGDPRGQEFVPCTTAQMERAIEGHFYLSKSYHRNPDLPVAGGLTVRQFTKLYQDRVGRNNVDESPFATFAYDAVWVYALALHKLLEEKPGRIENLHDKATTEAFVEAISLSSFQGVSGHIRFNGSDRLGNVTILQFFHNETQLVATYLPRAPDTGGNLHILNHRLRWLTQDGHAPVDGQVPAPSSCSIEGFRSLLGVSCEVALVIANIIGVVVLIILVILVIGFIKRRYDRKYRRTNQWLKAHGLMTLTDVTQCLSLDEWEIQRDNVVLNRKLGEGAFGKVCGGELFKEGEGWVAVAVKTLKIGARPENKLDFFSEADLMKRFKHNNIIQLLGVCTRGEPLFAIMEYCLHGDLKTYLLSRRDLVAKDCKEAEDVSPQQLTTMALDIALGLQYLHSLKYVHRDLACRNCLVHANKTVKIADFGMTRHTYDSDYYRFTKKGILPVRWMSPESLSDGIFTAKSDVWSYGVVVYEIVTFGSFPYQGLSNTQVLEYVKMGDCLQIPDRWPEDLKTFIYWCLAFKPRSRPELGEIVSKLESQPTFLRPCLDAPMTSVIIEDTDSLEMALPSHQTTVTHASPLPSALATTKSLFQRWSGGSQDKLSERAKRLSVPQGLKFPPAKTVAKTYLPSDAPSDGSAEMVRRNSFCGLQCSDTPRETRVDVGFELQRSASCQKHLSEKGTDNSSDYFSDTSKELYQTVTSL